MQLHATPRAIAWLSSLTALFILSGCAAVHTSIAKKDLDVQTKMSDTVFLDPVGPDKKTIFVQIRNTSDKPFEIEGSIMSAIAARGYRVTQDPEAAHFRLLCNVLNVSKASPTAAEAALAGGYGGVLGGVAVGGAVGGAAGGWTGAAVGGAAGGLLGGVVETVANASVKDVTYMVVTDIEITEKARPGVIVRQDSRQDASQGIGGSRRQTSSEVTTVKKYRTRIVSTANKANLEYEEAAPPLTAGLTRSISGLF
jgi:outer membrane lipoprotein SlyB